MHCFIVEWQWFGILLFARCFRCYRHYRQYGSTPYQRNFTNLESGLGHRRRHVVREIWTEETIHYILYWNVAVLRVSDNLFRAGLNRRVKTSSACSYCLYFLVLCGIRYRVLTSYRELFCGNPTLWNSGKRIQYLQSHYIRSDSLQSVSPSIVN